MKQPSPADVDVDVRGFHWALAALERIRARAVEEAAARLCDADRMHSHLRARCEAAEAAHRQELAATACPPASLVDPGLRRQALAYLASAEVRMHATRAALQAAGERCAEARFELQRADRDLQAVDKLRTTALGAFALRQRRLQAKEADFAWLARCAGRGGRP